MKKGHENPNPFIATFDPDSPFSIDPLMLAYDIVTNIITLVISVQNISSSLNTLQGYAMRYRGSDWKEEQWIYGTPCYPSTTDPVVIDVLHRDEKGAPKDDYYDRYSFSLDQNLCLLTAKPLQLGEMVTGFLQFAFPIFEKVMPDWNEGLIEIRGYDSTLSKPIVFREGIERIMNYPERFNATYYQMAIEGKIKFGLSATEKLQAIEAATRRAVRESIHKGVEEAMQEAAKEPEDLVGSYIEKMLN